MLQSTDPGGVDHFAQDVPCGGVGEDFGGRAVQLNEVERFNAEVRPGSVVPGEHSLSGVVLGLLGDSAPHLRRDEGPEHIVHGRAIAPDEALGAPIAVDVGGVDEVDVGVQRRIEYLRGRFGADIAPIGSELPGADSDDRS